MKYLEKTPIPINGPCVHRRYDNIFLKYYCNLDYAVILEEGCKCEYFEPRYITYK